MQAFEELFLEEGALERNPVIRKMVKNARGGGQMYELINEYVEEIVLTSYMHEELQKRIAKLQVILQNNLIYI